MSEILSPGMPKPSVFAGLGEGGNEQGCGEGNQCIDSKPLIHCIGR